MDDGETWTTPEDISLNEDLSMMNGHIVADTNNNLYVSYDHNIGNPALTMIYLKTFNGIQWSEPFIVSEGFYNSDHNQLVIDNNDRIYCFWYREHNSYYRYIEQGNWSEVIIPYEDEYYWLVGPTVVDNQNNLHCSGYYLEPGQSWDKIKVIYFQYLQNEDYWTDKTILSDETYIGSDNLDIDINNQHYPNVDYRQKTYNTGQYSDSTMFTANNGMYWSVPELIVNDPYEQRIIIDPYGRVHIFDREKMENGTKLVHYQKYSDYWQGFIVDSASNSVGMPALLKTELFINLAYKYSGVANDGDILFTKYDIETGINSLSKENLIDNFKIYPNPFTTQITIEYELSEEKEIDISVYNLNGQHIKTIYKGNTQPGRYRHIWNGKGENGKEDWVIPGLYLVRLQWGRNSVTKPVEYIK